MQRTPRFTNGQITIMVVGICVAIVLAPVGAIAATGSLVNITDPVTSSHKARVDSGGHLSVGDGGGRLTIDGSAQMAAPSDPFTAATNIKATGPTAVRVAQRAGQWRLAITSITGLATASASPFQVVRFRSFVVNSSMFACPVSPDAITTGVERDIPLGIGQTPIGVAYPSPLVFFSKSTASTTSCLYVTSEQVGAADFNVTTVLNGFWTR